MTRGGQTVGRERTSDGNGVLQIARKVAATIGADFFRAIAKSLCDALTADCVLIAEFVGGQSERCRTLAAWMDGEPVTFEYELAGTATAQLIVGKPCLWRSDAQTRFPDDPLLSRVGAQACIGVPLLDCNNKPIGALVTLYRRPITNLRLPKAMLEIFAARASAEVDRKREDDQLRESEQRYRAFIARNADAMWRVEFERPIRTDLPEEEQLQLIYRYGYLAECNDAMAQLLGLERSQQLIGARIEEIAPSSNPSIMEANRIGIHSGYKLTTVETRRLDGHGQPRVIMRSQWGIVEDGILQRIWGASRDITDLRHSEAALDASERRISELLEALPLLVITLNPDGNIVFCNQHTYRATGWQPDQVLGSNWLEKMIPPEEHTAIARDFARTSNAGTSIHFESTLLGPDKRRFQIAWDSTPLRDAAGAVAARANIGRDITQHKALEEQFQQAQKLAGIGRLAGGVAHDFNNLLTVILGYSAGLLEKRKPSDPGYSSLVEIRNAAKKAADLTSRLLAFSRRQLLRPEVVNLNGVVEDVLGMLRRLIGDNVHIVTALEPDLGLVRIDSTSFHHVMMNLAANSRDAMPRGGTLTISTSNIVMASSQTSVIPQGEYVRLTITDSGSGMTREVRSHMFEPFFTTKATGRGTGLGLSAVYGIVQQSAGHVAVETEPGRGTVFHIYLPRVYAPLGAAAPTATELGNLPGGPETILVVEDREDVRTLTVSILRGLGYMVIEADGPDSALQVAGDGIRPIHLLISDVVMPGMAVTEMAERLQAIRPNMKVLFVSGGGDANAVPAGPGYLPKPFTPAELAGAIRALLDQM